MSNLSKRILSALFLIPFVLYLVFLANGLVLHLSICLISAIASFEFTGICLAHSFRFQRVLVSALSFLLTYVLPISFSNPVFLLSFLPLSLMILFVAFMFSKSDLRTSLTALSFSSLGLFYCGILISFIYLIFHFNADNGRYFIFLLLLGTFLGDTGAYAFGRLFGKRKLYPKLSPGKTWAGAFGGFAMTFFSVIAVKFLFLPSISLLEAFLLSFLLSISCQIGDLAESFVKRGFNVKDAGNIIPGHGGMLDRIDALMFGAPVVFLFSFLR